MININEKQQRVLIFEDNKTITEIFGLNALI